MDKTKVEAILQWPVPTNAKQVRGFLGLSGHYRRFIKHYAQIARPLTDLIKKDSFCWHAQAEEAFQTLKAAVTTAPVLRLPDFSQPFVLETNASGCGVGAILSQQNHPIAYHSKKTPPVMQKQFAYVRELYALTNAIHKFRHYLVGHQFIVRSDQQALRHLTTQAIQTEEQQKWVHKLLGFDFRIEYKPGKDNVGVDALSRCLTLSTSSLQCSLLDQIRSLQQVDEFTGPLLAEMHSNAMVDPKYTYKDGLLWWHGKIIIPDEESLCYQILQEYHSSYLGGHAGTIHTYSRLAQQFYWPNMRKVVNDFVRCCPTCQQAKESHTLPGGLLQPLKIPHQVWEEISLDFIISLPKSKGYSVIFVVVDRLSKYAHFLPLREDFSSTTVADAFILHVAKLHAIPKSIVSNCDKICTSRFWQHLFRRMGTTLSRSSAYHPQSDGQTEAMNKYLEQYLRCFSP